MAEAVKPQRLGLQHHNNIVVIHSDPERHWGPGRRSTVHWRGGVGAVCSNYGHAGNVFVLQELEVETPPSSHLRRSSPQCRRRSFPDSTALPPALRCIAPSQARPDVATGDHAADGGGSHAAAQLRRDDAAAADSPTAAAAAADAAVVPAPSVLRDAPGEVLADSQEEHYLEYRAMTDMREPYRCGGGR